MSDVVQVQPREEKMASSPSAMADTYLTATFATVAPQESSTHLETDRPTEFLNGDFQFHQVDEKQVFKKALEEFLRQVPDDEKKGAQEWLMVNASAGPAMAQTVGTLTGKMGVVGLGAKKKAKVSSRPGLVFYDQERGLCVAKETSYHVAPIDGDGVEEVKDTGKVNCIFYTLQQQKPPQTTAIVKVLDGPHKDKIIKALSPAATTAAPADGVLQVIKEGTATAAFDHSAIDLKGMPQELQQLFSRETCGDSACLTGVIPFTEYKSEKKYGLALATIGSSASIESEASKLRDQLVDKNSPILIKQGDKVFIYSNCNGQWKTTALDAKECGAVNFPDVDGITLAGNVAIPDAVYKEIASKGGYDPTPFLIKERAGELARAAFDFDGVEHKSLEEIKKNPVAEFEWELDAFLKLKLRDKDPESKEYKEARNWLIANGIELNGFGLQASITPVLNRLCSTTGEYLGGPLYEQSKRGKAKIFYDERTGFCAISKVRLAYKDHDGKPYYCDIYMQQQQKPLQTSFIVEATGPYKREILKILQAELPAEFKGALRSASPSTPPVEGARDRASWLRLLRRIEEASTKEPEKVALSAYAECIAKGDPTTEDGVQNIYEAMKAVYKDDRGYMSFSSDSKIAYNKLVSEFINNSLVLSEQKKSSMTQGIAAIVKQKRARQQETFFTTLNNKFRSLPPIWRGLAGASAAFIIYGIAGLAGMAKILPVTFALAMPLLIIGAVALLFVAYGTWQQKITREVTVSVTPKGEQPTVAVEITEGVRHEARQEAFESKHVSVHGTNTASVLSGLEPTSSDTLLPVQGKVVSEQKSTAIAAKFTTSLPGAVEESGTEAPPSLDG